MNEFVARNGLIALDSSSISGPLTVSDSAVIGSGSAYSTSKLTITGPSTFNGNLLSLVQTLPSESIRFQMIQNGIETAQFGVTGTTNPFILGPRTSADFGIRAANHILFSTSNGNSVEMILEKTTGNLGLGVTSPSGKLHVNGTSVLSGSVRFGSSNGTSAGTWIDSNGTINVIRSINGATYGLRVHNGAGWSGHNGIEAIGYQYAVYGAQGSNGSVIASPLGSGAGVFGRGGVGVQGLGATPAGDSGSIGVMASTLFVNNASNTALYDRNVSAHIVGTSQTVLKVDSGTVSNILFITSSGNVGVGIIPFSGSTSPLSASLEVGNGSLVVNGFCSISKISPGGYGAIGSNYYLDSSGNLRRKNTDMVSIMDMPTAGFRWLSAGVAAANSIISTTQLMILNNAGNLGIGTTSPTYRLDVNGSFRATGSITATSGSDYFDVSHDITQPAQTGSQVYEVNITPTFRYTAPNQTQTALRVAATFSGSTALSSSQSNIIADFGSTSAGSQLVINDTTSGSIYMVNDVSGLPIIEANSNWDVFIYDYPNVVLKKTGSQIDITGKLKVSGSFILPLSQSTSPETGSAYWSGSFLYIYDGTQYRSASFS